MTIAAQQPVLWARLQSAPLETASTLNLYTIDWHVAAHTALSALLLRGVWLGEGEAPRPAKGSASRTRRLPNKAPRPSRLLLHLNTSLCLLWC